MRVRSSTGPVAVVVVVVVAKNAKRSMGVMYIKNGMLAMDALGPVCSVHKTMVLAHDLHVVFLNVLHQFDQGLETFPWGPHGAVVD